jgi:hypothetical protein
LATVIAAGTELMISKRKLEFVKKGLWCPATGAFNVAINALVGNALDYYTFLNELDSS